MKLKLIAILVFLISIMSFSVFADCIDTDKGEDYYTIGESYTNLGNVDGAKDCCKLEYSEIMGDPVAHIGPGGGPCFNEGPYLYEAICDKNNLPSHRVYKCPDSCMNGVCIAGSTHEVTVNGKVIRLMNVGSDGSIVIDVGGVIDTIQASTTKTINGIEISNEESYYYDLKYERFAKIGIPGGPNNYVTLKVYQGTTTVGTITERNKYFLKVGDSVTGTYGKIIKLENVGSGGSIVVSVNGGTPETIPASTTEIVNGIEITNIEIHYEDTKSERSAVIGVGEVVIPKVVSEIPVKEATETTTKTPSWKFSVSCTGEGGLDKFPKPFLVNGQLNKLKIVVGKNAPASDTIAAIDIAAKLQYLAKTPIQTDAEMLVPTKVDINPVLDTEITDPENYNLILIGQPSNNRLIKMYLSPKTATLEAQENGNNVALIVTGTTDLEVRYATNVLVNYEDYKLYGDRCEIINEGEVTYVPKTQEVKEPEYGCVANRICEPEYGENVANCPSDCKDIIIPLQCNGCVSDGNCLDFGMRIVENSIPKYCDLNKQFIPQKSANAACQNNFECDSNICAAGKCISEGFLKKIMNWFAKMFGYVVKG